MARNFSRIGVVGLGTMGAGIAEVLARAGIDVVGVELDEAGLARASDTCVLRRTGRCAAASSPRQEQSTLLDRIALGTDLAAVADCELVIEAIPERLELQARGLRASSTSLCRRTRSWPPTPARCRSPSSPQPPRRPGRVLGLHWFNPAPVMGLVEVVRTVVTDPAVIDDVEALVDSGRQDRRDGGRPRRASSPTRCSSRYLNNAVRMLEAHYATREDIDAAMRFGCGHPMGPLALLDLIGLDSRLRDPRHDVPPVRATTCTRRRRCSSSWSPPACSAARPAAASTPTPPRTPRRSSTSAPSAARRSSRPRRSARSASSAPARWPRGIVEVCAKTRLRRRLPRPQRRQGRRGAQEDRRRRWTSRSPRGRLAEDARDGDAGAGHAERPSSPTWPSATSSSRRSSRSSASSGRCSPSSTRSASRARCSRPPPRACRSSSARRPTSRPEDVVGMHWFNPAPAMKLVEVVPTVRHRRRRDRHRARGLR